MSAPSLLLSATADPSTFLLNCYGSVFIGGLYWHPMPRSSATRGELVSLARKNRMSQYVVIRKSAMLQAGFVPRGVNMPPKAYSVAAALAAQLGENWIGIFEITNGMYAFIAVSNGTVIPGCDLVGDRKTVLDRAKFTMELGHTWSNIYMPAGFEIEGDSSLPPIAELLKGSTWSDAVIRHVGFAPKMPTWFLVSTTVLITFLIASLSYLSHIGWRPDISASKAVRNKEVAAEIPPPPPKPKPWETTPSASDFLKHCIGSISDAPVSVGGWLLEGASCSGASVSAHYVRRNPSTVQMLLDAGKQRFHSPPTLSENAEKAVFETKLTLSPPEKEQLRPEGEGFAELVSHFQSKGMRVNLGAPTAHSDITMGWKKYSIGFESEISPDLVMQGLEMRGVRFSTVTLRLLEDARLSWSISGDVYYEK